MAKTRVIPESHSGRDHSAMSEGARIRANTYSMLASLLSAPPQPDLLGLLKSIELPPADEADRPDNIGRGWRQIRLAAAQSSPQSLDDEYHDLFIGVGRGEVVPYGSWHLTGFLMEKPLGDLRDDLKSLGIEAGEAHKDPEDHIAALCESMALVIRADDIDEARERRFFMRHLHSWAGRFFADLQAAKSARFYQSVGFLGQRFVEMESQYLNIQAH